MFENQLLIAMPQVHNDLVFSQAVIYICEHSEAGAVGLMINQQTNLQLKTIFEQLHIENVPEEYKNLPVFLGGPVQNERGFILHPKCTSLEASLEVNQEIAIATSRESMVQIAKGQGPNDMLVALGYSGWKANQLDEEIKNNMWLTCPADKEIIFRVPVNAKWEKALNKLGINSIDLSTGCGHA